MPESNSTKSRTSTTHSDEFDSYPPVPTTATAAALRARQQFEGVISGEPPRLQGYQVLRVIGRGATGIVFEARQLDLDRPVAIKFLDVMLPIDSPRYRRFQLEGGIAARLRHPNVVEVYAQGEIAGRPYLVMEMMQSGSLETRLLDGPLPPLDAARLVQTLARAIDFAHRLGVVHRDLKPGNVLLTADGTPKIADFDLAKLLDDDRYPTTSGTVVGTPAYMAPEQATGHAAAAHSLVDVYALGAILYECLVGQPPFAGRSSLATLELARSAEPERPRSLRRGIPLDLETICLKCLQKDSGRRYGSAGALADDLDRFVRGQPILARPVGIVGRAGKWARRRPAAAALIGVCALSFGVGAGGLAVHFDRLQAEIRRANVSEQAAVAESARADAGYRAARSALQQVMSRLDPRRTDIPALTELRRKQTEDALAFYLAVAKQENSSAEAQCDVADTALLAAQLQMRLGRSADAELNIRLACKRFAQLVDSHPANARFREGWASALTALGMHCRTAGQLPESWTCQHRALAIREALRAEAPEDVSRWTALAISHHGLANTFWAEGQPVPAERHFRQAIDWRERALSKNSTPLDRRRMAESEINLSLVLQTIPDRSRESIVYHDRAQRRLEEIHAADESDIDALTSLSLLRINWAYVQRDRGEIAEALADLSKNVPPLIAAWKREPRDQQVRDVLHRTHGVRAQLLQTERRHAEAADEWERVVATAPANQKNFQRLFLAEALVRADRLTQAWNEIETLRTELPSSSPWEQIYHLALVCGDLALRAPENGALDVNERQRLALRATESGLDFLERVRKAVPTEQWRSLQPGIDAEPRFEALRKRETTRQTHKE